jgi:hypothetical protein
MELLLQSWNGKIRVFPAVPDQWKDASFCALRAQGGFLVSASRKEGKTEWISIKSLSGVPCILKVPGWENAFQASKGKRIAIVKEASGEFRVDLRKGEEIILVPSPHSDRIKVRIISHAPFESNPYGIKKGGQLPSDQSWPLEDYNLWTVEQN